MSSEYRCRLPQLLMLLCLTGTSAAAHSEASPVHLTLTPATCVALQQGRLCYATVNVHWHSATPQDLCLQTGHEKLHCWPTGREGHWRYEFAANDSQQVQLTGPDGVKAKATISVNWVQKNPRVKRHWRLF